MWGCLPQGLGTQASTSATETTQALKAAPRPQSNHQCDKKSNWPPRHERTTRVYPDKTQAQQQHLSLWTCCQRSASNSGAISEPRDRKRQEGFTTAQTLLAPSAANTVLPWGETKQTRPPWAPCLLVSCACRAGCDGKLDRHTGTMCLPSMAIVERKVRTS